MKKQLKTNSLMEFLSNTFEVIGTRSYEHRWIVLAVCLVLLLVSGWLASRVRFDNSFEAYFDKNDLIYQDFLKFRDDFGSDEIAYILYEAPNYEHGPWNMEVMQKIEKLTRMLEDELPFIDEVTSITNVEFMEGVDDELVIHSLFDDFPGTQPELLKIRAHAMQKEIYINGLLSADGRAAAIIIEMEKSSVDPIEEIQLDPHKGTGLDNLYPQVVYNKIEEIIARPDFAGIKFYHTGDVPMNASYNIISQEESNRMGMISLVVIGVVLLLFFRNFMGVLSPLLVVILSIVITAGFVSICGWKFDLMIIILPPLLVAVGVADAVHIYAEFSSFYAKLEDRRAAIRKTLYLVGPPCFFTTLTTMAGFISMSISPIKAIRHFAIYSTAGVLGAFLLSVSFLIVLLSFGPQKPRQTSSRAKIKSKGGNFFIKSMEYISRFDIKYKYPIVLVSLVILIISGLGIVRIEVDSNYLNEFSKDLPIRQVTEYVDRIMGGTGGFNYVFKSEKEGSMIEPEILHTIESLQERANLEKDMVMKTYSVVDVLKDINRSFHNEDPAYYKLPETKELTAQYLLLYESSGGDEVRKYISEDYSSANLEVRTKMVATSKFVDVIEKLEKHLDQENPVIRPRVTGMGALWVQLLEYITKSQIFGFLLAFIMITIMMCIVFGSVRVGLLAMIPNLSPVLLTLGFMGWMGITLDYVKLLIGCVAIGIAVDDTVHMVTRYRYEFMKCRDYQKALFPCMLDVGRALFITTVVLILGFLVNIVSRLDSLAHFGSLVASTVGLALLADFLLLPALFLIFKPFGKK